MSLTSYRAAPSRGNSCGGGVPRRGLCSKHAWGWKGRIVVRGTHAALLAQGGLYAGMWSRQREAEEAREKLALAGEEAPAIAAERAAGDDRRGEKRLADEITE